MEIRSYRRVFDLERRIYRVDRLRLNPGGVPVRGIVYFLALLLFALVLGRVPLTSIIAPALPWYARDLMLPGLLATLLAVIRIEGRPFHLAARAVLRCRLRPGRLVALGNDRRELGSRPGELWRPPPIVLIPDGSDCRARRMRYSGPGALLIAVAHERTLRRGPLAALGWRAQLSLRELRDVERPLRGEVIVLGRGGRLRVG
ncbi:MAG TPA: hypothetical protein VGI52_01025 [Solirubrobacteraceae bacterium]|jgi:hypothetical protein